MKDFRPADLSVKTVGKFLVMEGKHEDNRFQFSYQLPGGAEVNAISSQLSTDGVLTVTVPKSLVHKETIIPVLLK